MEALINPPPVRSGFTYKSKEKALPVLNLNHLSYQLFDMCNVDGRFKIDQTFKTRGWVKQSRQAQSLVTNEKIHNLDPKYSWDEYFHQVSWR